MLKKDSLRLGIVLGFLAPVLGMFLYYYLQFSAYSVKEFFTIVLQEKRLLTSITSICLVANAVVFTLYINGRKDRTARGIFIATCIYAIASLLYRFF
jgi:hypothetical protein